MPVRLRSPPHALRAALVAVFVSVVVAPGCGAGGQPAELAEFGPSGEFDAGSSLISGPDAAVPTCNLGPSGSVCACVDEPLVVDAPNLYFVLDRSASMADDDKWSTIISVIGQVVTALGPRAAIGAAVFPDPYLPSSDPQNLPSACAAGIEVFAPQLGNAPAGTPGPTVTNFLTTLGHLSPDGGTPTAATLSALAQHIESLPGKTYVILATDGGPNCDPNLTCDIEDCQPNIDGDCPVAPASCCTDSTSAADQTLANLSCLDSQATIDAVQALANGGIPVYVVGVPGSEVYAELLDQLAEAGGTARTGGDGGVQYYAVSSAAEAAFTAALSQVAATITGSCTLTLGEVPPDPALVNVFLDEQPLPQAGPNGWSLSGATVTLLGSSCQEVVDGDVLDVRVVAGCPTVLR